jgi:hypothetical protein
VARATRNLADAGLAARRNVPVVAFGIGCCAVTMLMVVAMALVAVV